MRILTVARLAALGVAGMSATMMSSTALAATQAAQPASAPRSAEDFAQLSPVDGPKLSPNGKLLAARVAVRG